MRLNNFWSLVKFEYKKIFSSKLKIILFLIVLVFNILIPIFNANGGFYFHSIGNADITPTEARKLDKETINANKGFVTDEVIIDTILLTQNSYNNKENYFINYLGDEVLKPESEVDFILPNMNVFLFLTNLYREEFNILDDRKPIQQIDAESITDFYKMYKQMLADNINQEKYLTQNEKNKHLEMIENIQVPFYNEYAEGWFRFINGSHTLGLVILILLAIYIGSIFGKEYSCKTDAIILTTINGKFIITLAKIFTAISFAVISTLLIIGGAIGTYIFIYGFDGLNVPIQFFSGYEFCTYPLTIGEFVAIVSAVILVTAIAFSCFCALISVAFKSSLTSLSTLMICIFAPLFIPYINDRFLTQIVNCMFSRIFFHEDIFTRNFYTFGNIIFPPYIFYIILMSAVTFICIPIICKVYKNINIIG